MGGKDLKAMPKQADPRGVGKSGVPNEDPTLAAVGLTKKQSATAQRLAPMPDPSSGRLTRRRHASMVGRLKKPVAITLAALVGTVVTLVPSLAGKSQQKSRVSILGLQLGQQANSITFRITNSDWRQIIPVQFSIETNSASGWKLAVEESPAINTLEPRRSRTVHVGIPDGIENWRLKMNYIPQMSGVRFWMYLARRAVSDRSLPSWAPTFGMDEESVIEEPSKRPAVATPAN